MYAVAARIQGAEVITVPLDRGRGFALDERGSAGTVHPGRQARLPVLAQQSNRQPVDEDAIMRLAARWKAGPSWSWTRPTSSSPARQAWRAQIDELPQPCRPADPVQGIRPGRRTLRHLDSRPRGRGPAAQGDPALRHRAALDGSRSQVLEPAQLAVMHERTSSSFVSSGTRCSDALPSLRASTGSGRAMPTSCSSSSRTPARRLASSRAAGLLIRDVRGYPGLGRCLRITVGSPEQNNRLLEALR